MKDPVTVCKAKSILEKALAQDDMYLPAVYLLAEIYEQVSYSLQTLLPLSVPGRNIMVIMDKIQSYMFQTFTRNLFLCQYIL